MLTSQEQGNHCLTKDHVHCVSHVQDFTWVDIVVGQGHMLPG